MGLRIDQFPTSVASAAADLVPVMQSGVTRQVPLSQLATFAGAAVVAGAFTTLTVSGAATFASTLSVTGISTLSAGAVGAPSLTLGDTTTGYYRPAANQIGITVLGTQVGLWTSSGLTLNGNAVLNGEAANVLAQRNSTTAQEFRLYNTFTDASNYERLEIDWKATANVLQIYTTQNGTGSSRRLGIGTTGASTIQFFTNNGDRWQIGSTGHFVSNTDNVLDIGAAGATRPRTGYFGTSLVVPTVTNAAADLNLTTTSSGNVVLNPATDIKWGKALVALGGGAAPTLGTIGGSGPASAAQNTWLRVLDSTGAAAWLPVWK